MGNKGKEGQSSQRQLNDYETSRMLRIQENQGKLQQFGLKNIAKSLTSLVESQSLKKRKGKPKVTDEKDEEYIPDFGTDNEENCEEETSKSVKVHKKVHPTQYIAPMSMNKYANLARRRMTAHSAPHVVQSEEGTHLVGSDVTKKSKKYIGTNTTQQNQPRANMSMGELILNKKASQNQPRANMSMGEQILNKKASQNQPRENMSIGGLILNKKTSQKQAGVLEPNVVNPSSSKRSTLSGARRKLFVVDNNDVSFQDMNVADGYRDYDEDDENEDIDNTILRNEIEGNGRISQGNELLEMEDDEIDQLISEDDNQQDGLKDDLEMEEDEMDQLISEDDDNRQDGLEYDLEMEDDEPAQEQIITYSTKATAISNTKKRGPTMLHKIHTRSIDERQVIICNEFGQPIGPVVNGENIAGKFSRFLGTIARNHRLASLTHASWHKVPSKEKMWEYVLKKYIVPKEAKDWVLRSIGASWRLHKCRIKSKHFYKYKDNKSRLNNRPKYLTEKDFAMLLRFWSNKETMERCSLARDRRLSQKNNHTAGPKSFAMIREELRNEDPNKELPTLSRMFEYTRRRTEGRLYVDTFDDTAMKIEKMKKHKPCEEETSDKVDPFLAVMGKEYSGHRRLYGKGVTNKLIKRVSGGEELLLDMRRELDEEHARKKLELDEDHQRKRAELEAIQKDINNQQDKSIEDAVQKILQKLPVGIVQEYLT